MYPEPRTPMPNQGKGAAETTSQPVDIDLQVRKGLGHNMRYTANMLDPYAERAVKNMEVEKFIKVQHIHNGPSGPGAGTTDLGFSLETFLNAGPEDDSNTWFERSRISECQSHVMVGGSWKRGLERGYHHAMQREITTPETTDPPVKQRNATSRNLGSSYRPANPVASCTSPTMLKVNEGRAPPGCIPLPRRLPIDEGAEARSL